MKYAVYRHYAFDGTLLYVGISENIAARNSTHATSSSWADQVAHTTIEWCVSRAHAASVERVAIFFEKPLHNIMLQEKEDDGTLNVKEVIEFFTYGEIQDVARVKTEGSKTEFVKFRASPDEKDAFKRACEGRGDKQSEVLASAMRIYTNRGLPDA